MKKVFELEGPELDYWVAKAIEIPHPEIVDGMCKINRHMARKFSSSVYYATGGYKYSPSTDWSQGGPIIERGHICTEIDMGGTWIAAMNQATGGDDFDVLEKRGPTILIAAMRCFVASKYGDEVPDK